ncbi:MAG TPA: MerR family transcriptional regulator [bacterium]|nr:MerR family transcriptional regulator [bacterium]
MDKKTFYYIGDLSRMLEVPPHILRYWEKEFSYLKPLRDKKGNRIYSDKDIAKLKHIKFLVYGKGFSIRGAKRELRDTGPKQLLQENRKFLKAVLQEIQEMKKCLR